MKKKFIAILLTLVLIFQVVPVNAIIVLFDAPEELPVRLTDMPDIPQAFSTPPAFIYSQANNTGNFLAAISNEIPEYAIFIYTAEELAAIGSDNRKEFAGLEVFWCSVTWLQRSRQRYYVLANDIYLTEAWTPINHFYGILDGRGHTIRNLHITEESSKRIDVDYYPYSEQYPMYAAGLFGFIRGNGEHFAFNNITIKNLAVELAGEGINAHGYGVFAGGLIGYATAMSVEIYNSYVSGTGSINTSKNDLDNHLPDQLHFLIEAKGGLLGRTDDGNIFTRIENSYTTIGIGNKNGDNGDAGGLIGHTLRSFSVTGSHSTGNIYGSSAGGIIGNNSNAVSSYIENSFSTGNITAAENAGGLIAWRVGSETNFNETTILNSYSTGDIFAGGSAGGLIGGHWFITEAEIANSHSSGSISSSSTVGGLIGSAINTGASENMRIINSYSSGDMFITDCSEHGGVIGGLIGWASQYNTLRIYNCFSSGNKTIGSNALHGTIGGLIGSHHFDAHHSDTIIRESYASGNVTGLATEHSHIGGLVGQSIITIEQWLPAILAIRDSHTTVEIQSGENSTVGGFIGHCNHNIVISTSYAANKSDGGYGGGILGNVDTNAIINITDVFFDAELAINADNGFGVPKTTEEMKNIDTFTGFDMGGITWDIFPIINSGYPFLEIHRASYDGGGNIVNRRAVSVNVRTPLNSPVLTASDFTVNWYKQDETGIFATGTRIDGIEIGTELRYEIILASPWRGVYENAEGTHIVSDTFNTINIMLEPTKRVRFSGHVISGGEPAEIILEISSRTGSAFPDILSIETDESGYFQADVFAGFIGVYISGFGYLDFFETFHVPSNGLQDVEIVISKADGLLVDLIIEYTAAGVAGDSPQPITLNSARNIRFTLYNATSETDIDDFNISGTTLIIGLDSVSPGDEMIITATDITGNMADTVAEFTILPESNSVVLPFVQNGFWRADIISDNAESMALLYDENGNYIASFTGKGSIAGGVLPADLYRVVFIKNSRLIQHLNISNFLEIGLTEGTDFVLRAFNISPGTITELGVITVPALDEEKLFFTETASVVTNRNTVITGNPVIVRAEYNFAPNYAPDITAVTFVAAIPSGAELVAGSVTFDNKVVPYSVTASGIEIVTNTTSGIIRFIVIPTRPGNHPVSAFLRFTHNENSLLQPIGTAVIHAESYRIVVPHTIGRTSIDVRGTAPPNADVAIFDNRVQVGTAKANAVGNWNGRITLVNTAPRSFHDIHAEISMNGLVVLTETRHLIHNAEHPDISKITMINNGAATVFDFINPPERPPFYVFVPWEPEFVFTVEFTNTNAEITTVYVWATDRNGNATRIDTIHDPVRNIWVGTAVFCDFTLPVSVNATYAVEHTPQRYIYPDLEQEFINRLTEFENELNKLTDCRLNSFIDAHRQAILYAGGIINVEGNTTMITIPGGGEIKTIISDCDDLNEELLRANGFMPVPNSFGQIMFAKTDGATQSIANLTGNIIQTVILTNSNAAFGTPNFNVPFNNFNVRVKDYFTNFPPLPPPPPPPFPPNLPFFFDDTNDSIISEDLRMLEDSRARRAFYVREIEAHRNCTTPDICGSMIYRMHQQSDDESEFQKLLIAKIFLDSISNAYDLYGVVGLFATGAINIPATIITIIFGFGINRLHRPTTELMETIYVANYQKLKADWFLYKCKPDDPGQPMQPTIDPAGYVFEAVFSNRLPGVTATAFHADDEFGTNRVKWDATEFAQMNPLITDASGHYAWDTNFGWWQVIFEKEGYETADSVDFYGWLPVPPIQTEVHVGLISLTTPNALSVMGYDEFIEIIFDKYMDISTLNEISIAVNGYDYTLEFVNAEPSFTEPENIYATVVRIVPQAGEFFTVGSTVSVEIGAPAVCYAGVGINPFNEQILIAPLPKEIKSLDEIRIRYGTRNTISVTVSPDAAGANQRILAVSNSPLIVDVSAEAVTDANGTAVFAVKGELSGTAVIEFTMENTLLSTSSIVRVGLPGEPIIITFDADEGGFLNPGDAVRNILPGASVGELPRMPMMSKPGYRFVGWEDEYGIIRRDAFTEDRDITLTARWIQTPDDFMIGDVTGNNRVTSEDAVYIARMLLAQDEILLCEDSPASLLAADINGDGFVSIADVILLARWLVAGDNVNRFVSH
ncbi:MAG: dockerin type I repeat-containing protein [Defluviitaleaceae bacterium]|nr:dockerin type I repeat-containing protein [Defluviitaleaceae bacterium]